MSDVEFIAFPKIPRLKRTIVITEKIDGTNACVRVLEDGRVLAQSRNRFITPEKDNAGFAAWVAAHEDELRKGLGPGSHFGEWWGAGIQRRYGLTGEDKRFSLFNTGRWNAETKPVCCNVVPVLYHGEWSQKAIDDTLAELAVGGSHAAPGFMSPEGIVVFHAASGGLYKITLDNDGVPKGLVSQTQEGKAA